MKYKYFISCLYNGNKIKPLNTVLPETSAYSKRFAGQTNWVYFLIGDDNLLNLFVSADLMAS